MRMRVSQRVHRNARGEIEIALAIGGDEPGALAALETEIDPGKDGEQMRRGAVGHGYQLAGFEAGLRCVHVMRSHRLSRRKTKRAAFCRRHAATILGAGRWLSTRQEAVRAVQKGPRPYESGSPHPYDSGKVVNSRRNMWKARGPTLAPESRHIVAFLSSGTTSRAAKITPKYLLCSVNVRAR